MESGKDHFPYGVRVTAWLIEHTHICAFILLWTSFAKMLPFLIQPHPGNQTKAISSLGHLLVTPVISLIFLVRQMCDSARVVILIHVKRGNYCVNCTECLLQSFAEVTLLFPINHLLSLIGTLSHLKWLLSIKKIFHDDIHQPGATLKVHLKSSPGATNQWPCFFIFESIPVSLHKPQHPISLP